MMPLVGTASTASTSRADLEATIASARQALRGNPFDAAAAIRLSDALLRQTRVTGNAGLAKDAETALLRITHHDPEDYGGCRMLAAVYVSQHRFTDGIAAATRCLQLRQNDAWIYGVLGDAHLELGDYDAAFDAFDRMSALKPNAASYARASYARELQGDLAGARGLMTMALDATPAQDPESLAWHRAELGFLWLAEGRLDEAARQFAHAEYSFPGHPFALAGRARVAFARGDVREAYDLMAARVAATPAPDDLAFTGDLAAALGRAAEAERYYGLAEAAWISDAPDPSRLARFLAERNRRPADALRIATEAATTRHDIFTLDALAWALYRNGKLDEARMTIARALAIGTRDATIRAHADTIAKAQTAASRSAWSIGR